MTAVRILGRDGIGWVAEDPSCGGFRYYLTACCGASAKGSVAGGEPATVCRSCYVEVDPMLGDLPASDRCSCVGPCADGRTYGAASCPVHGTVPESRVIDPSAEPPIAVWQAVAIAEGHPFPEYVKIGA